MELNEVSKDYLCINTHKVFYHYKRFPYDVACAPAIFQQAMGKILEGLPVGCFLDDILVTGSTEEERDKNLENTLQCLETCGIKLNSKKCAFKQDSVKYFLYIVTAESYPLLRRCGQSLMWIGLETYRNSDCS